MKRSASALLALSSLTLVFSVNAAPTPGTTANRSPAQVDNNTCNGRPCIQIGTFNLYSLGSNVRSGQGLRTQGDVQRLVDLVTELGIEIAGFQETNTSLSVEENGVVQNATQQWNWLKQALKKAGYKNVAGSAGWDHRMVIAYHKKSVRMRSKQTLLVSQTFDFGDGCRATNQRMPIAVTFEAGELSFRVVGLHLKAPGTTPACSSRVRTRQASQLVQALDSQLTNGPQGIFLVGDFGAKARDRSLKAIRKSGKFKELTAKSKLTNGSATVSSLVAPARGLFDHVFYRVRTSRKTWVPKSTLVFDPLDAAPGLAAYIAAYSDHVPVMTSLYTDVP